ncbi:MAG: metallophosphoesterase family protein, partial [Theionarchaea archaeon]|nr:metallophosphoesterase family protein [Theionarchaea archaeon]
MRIGLISDIHSNLHALDVVLDELEDCDRVICLGDIVGYGAHPNECVKTIKDGGIPCVLGNHDAACIDLLSLGWFNPFAASAIRWTLARLSGESLNFIRNLRRTHRTESCYLVHGSPREPTTEYLTSSLQAQNSFGLCDDQVILVGHTHVPLVFMQRDEVEEIKPLEGDWVSYKKRRVIFNPGSVGQPRDGDPRASYSVIDTDSGRIGLFRTEYDVESARNSIVKEGLPERLGDRLL